MIVFTPNTVIKSTEVNANFTGLKDGTDIDSSAITTAKIANDAVTAAKIDWASTGANGGIWWEELGRTTLSVAGDTISVTSIPARDFIKIMYYVTQTGGTVSSNMRFNNDSGANYAQRFSDAGAADSTTVSQTSVVFRGGTLTTGVGFGIAYIANTATTEKIASWQGVVSASAGAGTAPGRVEGAFKWSNTTDAINRVDLTNGGTGDFAIGSEVVVLGHN